MFLVRRCDRGAALAASTSCRPFRRDLAPFEVSGNSEVLKGAIDCFKSIGFPCIIAVSI